MKYKKGKLIKKERRVMKKEVKGKDILKTKEEFQAICKTCNRLYPDVILAKITYEFL